MTFRCTECGQEVKTKEDDKFCKADYYDEDTRTTYQCQLYKGHESKHHHLNREEFDW